MSDLVDRLGVWLREWHSDVDRDWRRARSAEEAARLILGIIQEENAIVPKYPTYEQVMQGLHPAIPGSVTEIYCEMIKAAPKLT